PVQMSVKRRILFGMANEGAPGGSSPDEKLTSGLPACSLVLVTLITGCDTARAPLLTDDLERLGLAEAVEEHASHLEHGAKLGDSVEGVGLGEHRVSRAEYAAALRRFAAHVRSAVSDRELARAVEGDFEIREVVLDQPFKVTAYYEPIVPGSRTRRGAFTQPLYRAPPELERGKTFHTR